MECDEYAGESDIENSELFEATPRPDSVVDVDISTHGMESHLPNTTNVPPNGRQELVIADEAVDIDESGASNSSPTAASHAEPARLLLVSNRVKFSQVMVSAMLPNVKMVTFKHDQCDLDGVLSMVATTVSSQKFESIGLIFNSSGSAITLCGVDEKLLTMETIVEMTSVREFFVTLANNHIDRSWVNARIDFLMCSATSLAQDIITNAITEITEVPCTMSKDLGTSSPLKRIAEDNAERKKSPRTVGSLYFRVDRLRPVSSKQSMSFFEKIRTVGKGAYGSAVLYRKKDDDSLVILKEINMHDLNAAERQLALNEVKVLSVLEHPNIISYFDSFEEDGILMIEMDYADGGTVAQLLSNQDQPLEERRILEMFQQMVAAIKHIHGHKILHRDLKTQNIFLTKEGVIKMGDFGISKMLTTGGKGASTVLGTPYYISPEMCEGKPYGPKSDIWALGCILYEMACLERTFEGSNLPAVVNKIMKGVYTPVKGPYSNEFKKIVETMLDRDPAKRPSADELWTDILPSIMTKYTDDRGEEADDELGNSVDSSQSKKTMSVLYYLTTQSLSLSAIAMPNKIKIKEVAVGKEHAIIISQECMIFTYGRGTEGQLGHDDDKSRSTPVLVEALKGKSVNRACCGTGFSIFGSSNGIVMTCGDNSTGCLGHEDRQSLNKPKLIEGLLHVDVMSIACGTQHVAIVGNTGDVYTWGDGSHGKLGLGNEVSHELPQAVSFSEPVNVKEVFCSDTGTMFLTDVGVVWACGSNKSNRLGLNNRQGFLAALKQAFNKAEVEGAKEPAVVRDLCRFMVTSISMGVNHTAVLVEGGKVITFGRNAEGQLGSGDSKPQQGLVHVKSLSHVSSMRVGCTALSTITITNGQILLLGSRNKYAPPADVCNWLDASMKRQYSSELSRSRQGSASSQRSVGRSLSQTNLSSAALRDSHQYSSITDRQGSASSMRKLSNNVDGDSESSMADRKSVTPSSQRQLSNSSTASTRPVSVVRHTSLEDLDIQYQPTPLLNFQSEQSETVILSGFTCHEENVIVLVETTAIPSQKKLKKRRSIQKTNTGSYTNLRSSASSREAVDELSNSETSEMDTLGTVPSWIKAELADAAPLCNNDTDPTTVDSEADEKRLVSKPPISPSKKLAPKAKLSRTSTLTRVTSNEKHRDYHSDVTQSSSEEEDGGPDLRSDQEVLEDESSRPLTGNKAATSLFTPSSKSHPQTAPKMSNGLPTNSKAAVQSNKKVHNNHSGSRELQSKEQKELLLEEIARLKQEAELAELRMSKLEGRYTQMVDDIQHQSVQKAVEKERQLQDEVKELKEVFISQNQMMQKQVLSLQEQLLKVQMDSNRSPEQKSPDPPPSGKSSICLLQ